MEKASQLSHLPNIKKMIAKGNYYRLRIGIYRLGLIVENDTIILLRFVHRKDIYNYFP
jgi:mRNA interferase RelE/StbE